MGQMADLERQVAEIGRQLTANQAELDRYWAEYQRERALRQADEGARGWARAQNRQQCGHAPGEDGPPAPQAPVVFGAEAAQQRELRAIYDRACAWAHRQNEVDARRGSPSPGHQP